MVPVDGTCEVRCWLADTNSDIDDDTDEKRVDTGSCAEAALVRPVGKGSPGQ